MPTSRTLAPITLAIMLAAWAWCAARSGEDGLRRRILAGLFGVLLVLMPMFDKQGFLFLGGAVVFLGWQAWQEGTPRARRLLAGTGDDKRQSGQRQFSLHPCHAVRATPEFLPHPPR